MDFNIWLAENEIQRYLPPWLPKKVSRAEARNMFGPVFHGTTEMNRQLIKNQGFQFFKTPPRQGNVSHGFKLQAWQEGAPPPIHFLGYGVYFSVSKTQASLYNRRKDGRAGSTVGLTPYYINAPRLKEMNLASPRKMMDWWRENGYDMPSLESLHNLQPSEINQMWIEATDSMTKVLRSQWDAVHFVGKGFGTLLDGNQICVYNPENICVIDETSEPELDAGNGVFIKIGDRIQVKGTKATGIITSMRVEERDDLWPKMRIHSNYYLTLNQPKGFDQVKALYADRMREILKTDNFLINVRFKNMKEYNPSISLEQCTEDYLNYLFKQLPSKFPSGLIDRVLGKGERVS